MLKLLIPVIVLIALVGITFLTDKPQPTADFTFINRGDINTLDLQRMSWMQDLRVARTLYEGLVETDVFSWEQAPTPAGATHWEISEDGKTYTFYLRPESTWSNGQPVTSQDYLYTWRRALLPDIASDYVAFFHLIQGGEDFYHWRERALQAYIAKPFDKNANTLFNPALTVEQIAQQLINTHWFYVVDQGTLQLPTSAESLAKLSDKLEPLATETLALSKKIDDASRSKQTRLTPKREELREQIQSLFDKNIDAITALRDALTDNYIDHNQLWKATKNTFDKMVAVKAPDDHTFIVTLNNPTPYFIDLCGFPVLFPVYPDLVHQYELPRESDGRLNLQLGWTKPDKLISNGPYTLTQWRFKRNMYFSKNEHYWNKDRLNVDTIQAISVEDPNAGVLAFDSGAIDWLSDVSPSYRADILASKQQFYQENKEQYDALVAQGLDPVEIDRNLPQDKRAHIHAFPAFGTYFYNFNCTDKLPDGRDNPFTDSRIRRAFAMAIDKNRIVNDIKRIGEPVATTFVPPNSIGNYNSPKGLSFNPKKAQALLADAGFPNGDGFITVSILFNKDGGHDLIAQAIKNDWETYLGVDVILEQKEVKVFRNDLKNQNYMIARAGWFGDYGDPTTFLDLNRTEDGNNDRKFSNEEYDELLDKAALEPDPEKRMRLLEKAESIIVDEEMPLIPIYHYVTMYMFDPHRISGITPHPRLTQNLYLIDILDDDKGSNAPLSLPPRTPNEGDTLLGGAQ